MLLFAPTVPAVVFKPSDGNKGGVDVSNAATVVIAGVAPVNIASSVVTTNFVWFVKGVLLGLNLTANFC